MNLGKLIMGIGGIIAGGNALKEAFSGPGEPTTPPPQQPRLEGTGRSRLGNAAPMKTQIHEVKNINERVSYVIQMIKKGRDNPKVRQIAVQTLSRKCEDGWCVPEKDWPAEIRAIFDFVRQNIRYTRDTYGKDLFQHPLRTLHKDVVGGGFGGGDCDDYTIVLGSMLQAVGYPVKARVIRTRDRKPGDWNHIYLLVGLPPGGPKKWIPLDASVDQPAGWQAPKSMIAEVRDFEVPA